MERYQAGQEDTLVEVHMEKERLNPIPRPTASPAYHPRCFRCVVALAAVMGLVIVGLVAGFILHSFLSKATSKPDCQSRLPSQRFNATFNMTCQLKKNDQGTYVIFTVNKTATYLIYGWVKRRSNKGSVTLESNWGAKRHTIEQKEGDCTEVFFSKEVKLFKGTTVSLFFNEGSPNCAESFFRIYEL